MEYYVVGNIEKLLALGLIVGIRVVDQIIEVTAGFLIVHEGMAVKFKIFPCGKAVGQGVFKGLDTEHIIPCGLQLLFKTSDNLQNLMFLRRHQRYIPRENFPAYHFGYRIAHGILPGEKIFKIGVSQIGQIYEGIFPPCKICKVRIKPVEKIEVYQVLISVLAVFLLGITADDGKIGKSVAAAEFSQQTAEKVFDPGIPVAGQSGGKAETVTVVFIVETVGHREVG